MHTHNVTQATSTMQKQCLMVSRAIPDAVGTLVFRPANHNQHNTTCAIALKAQTSDRYHVEGDQGSMPKQTRMHGVQQDGCMSWVLHGDCDAVHTSTVGTTALSCSTYCRQSRACAGSPCQHKCMMMHCRQSPGSTGRRSRGPVTQPKTHIELKEEFSLCLYAVLCQSGALLGSPPCCD
jgi:hypothetical protein